MRRSSSRSATTTICWQTPLTGFRNCGLFERLPGFDHRRGPQTAGCRPPDVRTKLSAEDFHELCTLLKEKNIFSRRRTCGEKFRALMGALCRGELLEEAQRTAFVLTAQREAALRDCLSLLRSLKTAGRPPAPVDPSPAGNNRTALNLFFTGDRRYILYIQYDRTGSPASALPAGRCRSS